MRKNYYRKSMAKRRQRIKDRLTSCVRILIGIAFLIASSFLFVLGHDVLTQCRFFQSHKISVYGNQRLSAQDILRQAQIDKETNVLSVNLSVLRKRLLAHTWICEAEVRRELPDGIQITIHEHQPLAVLKLGRHLLINQQGDIFKAKNSGDPNDLPVITGLEYTDIHVPGQPWSTPFKAAMTILKLGRNTHGILPNQNIQRIHVDREIGITLYARNPQREIKLGFHNYSQKYKSLKYVLAHLRRHKRYSGFVSIDLNNISRIVAQPLRIESPSPDQKEV